MSFIFVDLVSVVYEWHQGKMAERGRRWPYGGSELEWFQYGWVVGGMHIGGSVLVFVAGWEDVMLRKICQWRILEINVHLLLSVVMLRK